MMTPQDVLTGEKLLAPVNMAPLAKEDLVWDIARAIGAARGEGDTEAKSQYAQMLAAAIADERDTAASTYQTKFTALLAQKLAAERARCIEILETMATEIRKNSPGKEYLIALAIEKLR